MGKRDMESLSIVTFLWNGERWNVERDHGIQYVNTLYSMVKRNLLLPFKFVCFTDNPDLEIES